MATTLPVAKEKIGKVVSMLGDVLADVEADRAYLTQGGDPQALIDRKLDLVQAKILPALREAKVMLEGTLIPWQQESIDSVNPETGKYGELFDAQKTLVTEINDLYNKTLPWAMATFGATEGDKADGHAKVADFRKTLTDNLNGYEGANGHNKGVKEYQLEMANRKDPNYAGTEVLYGETQPYSLPRKIAQYTAERSQRAGEINAQAVQINEILGKIETLSGNKYNLQSYRLPADVSADKTGVARVQALSDNGTLRGLADKLTAIGNEATQASGDISLSVGGSGQTIPSGTQPAITLANQQQLGLLALEAAKRLAPSSAQAPQSAACYYAVARFLFSDGIIGAAQDSLDNQVPQAETFLNNMAKALSDAITLTYQDDSYVDSGGASETQEQIYGRQIASFSALASVLREGMAFFDIKQGWNQDSFATIDKVSSYYNSLGDVYDGGLKVNDSEVEALETMRSSLKSTYDSLETTRRKVSTWMSQLNSSDESALRRVSESLSELQDKTRTVLETNIEHYKLRDQAARSDAVVQSLLRQTQESQDELQALLKDPALQDSLSEPLVGRIEDLHLGRGMWADSGASSKATQTVVVRKAEFGAFLDAVLGMFQGQNSSVDLSSIKTDMLTNPQSLVSLVPDSAVLDFGDTADGFYVIYQTDFGVPNGLETSNRVTLGNVAQVWGNNVSVNGYQFSSPPNDYNAPYGDKGVEVQIESLQGDKWVNYLSVGLHRFGLDVPADMKPLTQAQNSRILVFDDFAMMLLGDRLYVGLAGFSDFAAQNAAEKPIYYGGNLKSSLKMTEVMKLNFEQQEIFAKDPRKFLQTVNLDFTGYDPDLDHDFTIYAEGENKHYSRTQLGPSFNVASLVGSKDQFTVDLFFASSGGTDDVTQKSAGATILKGFTIRSSEGKTLAQISNRLTGELGQKQNSASDRLSVTLPDYGVVISGQGKLLGSAKAYYGEVSKKIGEKTTLSLGYGSSYVGMNNRLSIQSNTSFTLGDLWQSVVNKSADRLKGGETLKMFNKELDDFFKVREGEPPSLSVQELKQVFAGDVARQLVSQEIGRLTQDIQELRKAGAILDNTRTRGTLGFVSNPISNDATDRATGAGFVSGTYTEFTLTKSQKALMESKAESLYREGLRLQTRLADLVGKWQAAVVAMAQAQWELKMAEFSVQNSPSEAARREAEVRRAQAEASLNQALLGYNSLAGRKADAAPPFANLNAEDLQTLLAEIRKTIASPDRLSEILRSLDRSELEARLGRGGFNAADWLPWVEKLSLSFGAQFEDMMANQVLTLGASLRLPVYDPASKSRDKSYVLEKKAVVEEMKQAWSDWRLQASQQVEVARAWSANAQVLQPGLPKAADDLHMAILAYRNGIVDASQLREAFASWQWYMSSLLEARGNAALAEAYLDAAPPGAASGEGTLQIARLEDAFAEVSRNAHGLKEVALRQEAAAAMTEANDHRIQKAMVDLYVGTGLTATGTAWLPSIAMTGIPVWPVMRFEFKPDELRELQAAQGQGQSEYYRQLKVKLEADLAASFTQNFLAFDAAGRVAEVLRRDVIPQLVSELGAAQARELPGGPDVPVTSASRRLDQARTRLSQAELAQAQARVNMNYLLGRPQDAPLEISLTQEQALEGLRRILAQKDPVAAQRKALAARVQVARAAEAVADKDLKVEQLAVEPISLVARSLGRLIKAVGKDALGSPDLAAAARVQVLTEERALESFERELKVQSARARAGLRATLTRLERLQGRQDPASRLERASLEGRGAALRASLASFGETDGPAEPGASGAPPSSYAELRSRLAEAQSGLAGRPSEERVDLVESEEQGRGSSANLRFYRANSTLDQSVKIDKNFVEGWLEIRLRSSETPAEVLLSLSRLRQEKADRIYRNTLAGASARGAMLATQFEADVRLWRWAQERLSHPDGNGQGDFARFSGELRQRLMAESDEMAALLGLDARLEPEALLGRLVALVPESPSGARELGAVGEEFLSDVRKLAVEHVRRSIFDNGSLPAGLGSEDNLMGQLRADTIAQRMSYKGFTPVAAFGVFRGQSVGGAFLEAPDPQSIERGLTNVLSDALRKELESNGRLRELSARLSELMNRVKDGSRLIEARSRQIEAAQAEYRALLGLARDAAGLQEARLAQERLVSAWLEFSRGLTETKAAFIELVCELEALGQGRSTVLRPAAATLPIDASQPRQNPRAELLEYWSRRMQEPGFVSGLDSILSQLGPGVTAEMRERLRGKAGLYQNAVRDGEAVLLRDFTAAERIDLLTRNDKEGKRLAVRSELAGLLDVLGRLDPHSNPAWARLLGFLRADIEEQSRQSGSERVREFETIAAMRAAYWHAVPAPVRIDGAFQRLENLHRDLKEAKQSLLESYLSDLHADPGDFVLKDVLLDKYLKAEIAFDAELVKIFKSPEVRQDRSYAQGLDGLYNMRRSLQRSWDAGRFGRGLRAVDALIMLEESRLAAERWRGASPEELGRTGLALQNLRELKARWLSGASGSPALHAVTKVGPDGRRLWTLDGWLTKDEVARKIRDGAIVEKDGRFYVKGEDLEVLGGIDAAQAGRDAADQQARANQDILDLHADMGKGDFLLTSPGESRADVKALKLEDVFGPKGLAQEGKVLFFKAPKPEDKPNALHEIAHPLQALSRSPQDSAIYVYMGEGRLAPGLFPTLESLRDSAQAKDFRRLIITDKGAGALMAWLHDAQAAALSQGWLEVKLNGYGFARDEQGGVVELYVTEKDFASAMRSFRDAGKNLRAAERELIAARRRVDELQDDASSQAADKFRAAQADVENKAKALEQAKTALGRSRTWSLYRSADLALNLDAGKRVIGAAAEPVYGGSVLNESFGGGVEARTLAGELYAAVVDRDGRVQKAFTDEGELERAARSWTLKTLTAADEAEGAAGSDGLTVRPNARLGYYEDGSIVDDAGRPLAVSLSRRYLVERREDLESKAGRVKHWATLPRNWIHIALEVPRGIVGIPVELLTGRDLRQHNYLGRAAMYKLEGGETGHRGFFGGLAHAADVANLLPDKARRYYDPSQFPAAARIDSRILPGQSISDKELKDMSGRRDIHFGVQSLKRAATHAREDVEAAKERTLSRFHGGVEDVLIETRRGRGGHYEESRVSGRHGSAGIDEALEDPLVAQQPVTVGSGRDAAVFRETPGNIAVDRVERRVKVLAGADQYGAQEAALKDYPAHLAAQAAQARGQAPKLQAQLAAAQASVSGASDLRERVRAERENLWARFHELAWRIAEQTQLEAQISRLQNEAEALRRELDWWRDYARRLKESVHQVPPAPSQPTLPSQPGNPTVPTAAPTAPAAPTVPTAPTAPSNPNQPMHPGQLWSWAAVLAVIAAVIGAGVHFLLRRKARLA